MEFFLPEVRLSWFDAGPSSPNKTGALLACWVVACLWPMLRVRAWWGMGLSFLLMSVGLMFMLQTGSRGALVGVVAGVAVIAASVLLFTKVEQRNKDLSVASHRLLGWALGLVLLVFVVGYAQALGVSGRMALALGGEDGSTNVRFELYRAGLAMIHAAPGGWGHGQAGEAFGQWYQQIGHGLNFLSLVNSHLTFMADYGLLFQVLYLAGWAGVFVCVFPHPWTPLRATSLGVWVCLFVTAIFSNVLTLVWLWLVPVGLLLACVVQRFRWRHGIALPQVGAAFAGVVVMLALLHGGGRFASGELNLQAASGWVRVGPATDGLLLVIERQVVVGSRYGHCVRGALATFYGAEIFHNGKLPTSERIAQTPLLVWAGGVPNICLRNFSGQVVLLNPPSTLDEAELERLPETGVRVFVGTLGDWRRASFWRMEAETREGWQLIEVRGAADFLPDWVAYLDPSWDEDSVVTMNTEEDWL